MALSCGIVGLPNVGKSTLFNALTAAGIEASNYPFCTIEPNVGIVTVPDERLEKITALIVPDKKVPTTVEFVDIAGLVEGASKGEGLGNKFLSHIRQVQAIAHVVRCFDDPDVVHVHGDVDPLSDIGVIETELCLADMESVQKSIEKAQKQAKSGKKEFAEKAEILQGILGELEKGLSIREQKLNEKAKECIYDLQLLSSKPVVYVCNVSESQINEDNAYFKKVAQFAQEQNAPCIKVSAKVESEIAELNEEEKKEFLQELGLKESGLDTMIRTGYQLLELITFFTAGKQECRAWTIQKGTLAPQAAGTIHSDFEKGFIRAEIYHCDDLFEHKSEAELKSKGLIRLEGKTYPMKDGDIAHFRFNV